MTKAQLQRQPKTLAEILQDRVAGLEDQVQEMTQRCETLQVELDIERSRVRERDEIIEQRSRAIQSITEVLEDYQKADYGY